MKLCNADITSKNEFKVRKYKKNFEKVEEKLKTVEEKDHVRNFQPPIDGKIIMETFDLKPCGEIGAIKKHIKEAILDGVIPNDYDEAYTLMIKFGKELGLKPIQNH
jgi:ABC-type lipoprotein release transport system permease subunit